MYLNIALILSTYLEKIGHVTSQQEIGLHQFQSRFLIDSWCVAQQEMKIASLTVSHRDGGVLTRYLKQTFLELFKRYVVNVYTW